MRPIARRIAALEARVPKAATPSSMWDGIPLGELIAELYQEERDQFRECIMLAKSDQNYRDNPEFKRLHAISKKFLDAAHGRLMSGQSRH